jgi:hypothetical protein
MSSRTGRSSLVAAALLFVSGAARAQSDDTQREAELFGEPAASATVAAPRAVTSSGSASLDAEIFGAAPGQGEPTRDDATTADEGAGERIADRVSELSSTLEIGGTLWLWSQLSFSEQGPAKGATFSAPSFADLYLDARPSDRLRGFFGARVTHDFTVGPGSVDFLGNPRPETRFLLDQYWVKADVARTVFVTAGRQRVRWGSSRIWNPTDFLHQDIRDPLAFLDLRLGVPMLKLHLPVESLGWNFYAVAELEDVRRLEDVGAAVRAELVLGPAELALSAYRRHDRPLGLGVDLSTALWLFDFRAELGLRRGVKSTFLRGDLSFTEPFAVPERYSRDGEWIPQLVLGADISIPYSAQDNVTLGAEYFFNDAGYDNERLYPALLALGGYNPLYAGRHYLALFALLSRPGRWEDTTFLLNGLANLSDGSVVARFDWNQQVLTFLSLRAFVSAYLGSEGVFRLAVDVPPIPRAVLDANGLPSFLENGLRLVPNRLDVGVTLVLSL